MLFTERDYRCLVLLYRLLAEQNGIPRNFSLLPYLKKFDPSAPSGTLLDSADPAQFSKLILSDQRREAIAQKLGMTVSLDFGRSII